MYIHIYIFIIVALLARISLILSLPLSLLSIVQSGLLNTILCPSRVLAGRLTLARQHEGILRKTSFMCLSLFIQQYPTCLVCLNWIVLELGCKWPYSYCFVGCCFQDLFNITHTILVQFMSIFFSIRFFSVHVLHPYRSIDNS